ncbi:MAG: DUF349 domain-containing protein [Cytophagales bacterium]
MKPDYKPEEYGYVKDGKVFRKAFLKNKDLEIGIVRETEEKSIQYFVERFLSLREKVEELEKSVDEATNKGSFLMKLLHMKDKMATYKGIGDFEALIERLDKIESRLQENIAENRVKNLEIKEALLKDALALKDSTDWEETAEKMKELRLNWVRTGAVIEDKQEELEQTFHNTVNHFFEEKKKYNEKKRKIIAERSKQYKYLISKVRKLMYEQDKDVIINRIQGIKKDWESVGEIPERLMKSLEGKLAKSIQNLKNPKRRRRIGQHQGNNQRDFQSRPNYRERDSSPRRQAYQGNERNEEEFKKLHEQKSKLLNMALELKELPIDKSLPLARELQDKWLKSGKSTAPEIRSIYNKFRETIALIFEKNHLETEIMKKHTVFSGKSKTEQKIIRISTLKEMIRRDKGEIKLFEDNLNQSGVMENQDRRSQDLISKLRGQKFRLKIKESLLNEIELN